MMRTRPTAWPRRRGARAAPRSRDRGCTKTRGHDAVDRVDRAEERARARPRRGRRADRADGRADTAPRSGDRDGRSEAGGGRRARSTTPIARRARADARKEQPRDHGGIVERSAVGRAYKPETGPTRARAPPRWRGSTAACVISIYSFIHIYIHINKEDYDDGYRIMYTVGGTRGFSTANRSTTHDERTHSERTDFDVRLSTARPIREQQGPLG